MKPVPRPTLRGVAVMVALVVVVTLAVVTGTPELAPLAVVIGVPTVVAPWLAHRRARQALTAIGLHAHVEPAAAEVGSTMHLVLYVSNRTARGPAAPSLGLLPPEGRWSPRGVDRSADRRPRLGAGDCRSRAVALPGTGDDLLVPFCGAHRSARCAHAPTPEVLGP